MTFQGAGATIWTNQPAAATVLFGSAAYIQKANLAAYTECRLTVNKLTVAAQAGALLELRYATAYSQTAASYQAASSPVASVGIAVVDQLLDSGWRSLVPGALGDVFLTVIGTGGNGTIDPVLGQIVAEFR